LAEGDRVEICRGSLKGLKGTLVRRANGMRFVLAIQMINQQAAIEIDADYLEPIIDPA
jgi:hypothetical protein